MLRAICLTLLGLTFLTLSGCTSSLISKASQVQFSWDKPDRIVAAYRGPNDELWLVLHGTPADEHAPRDYTVRVPLQKLAAPPRYDPHDPEALGYYSTWISMPMLPRSNIHDALPPGALREVAIAAPPPDWHPNNNQPLRLPTDVTEAVALLPDQSPPVFAYISTPPLIVTQREVYFTLAPINHHSNAALYVLTPLALVADVALAPVYTSFLIIWALHSPHPGPPPPPHKPVPQE